jgi:hypothetical protein
MNQPTILDQGCIEEVTLILACLTEDCAYQVSDRRITSFDPPHELVDDNSIKTVLVEGQVVFGYSGISHIEGQRTDAWIADIAAKETSGNLSSICRRIRIEASRAFQRTLLESSKKRHAFQCIGWFWAADGSSLRPGIVTIHNALDLKNRVWRADAKAIFDGVIDFPQLSGSQFKLTWIGEQLSEAEISELNLNIAKCMTMGEGKQEAVLEALIQAALTIGNNRGPASRVGPNLMAVSLPRAAADTVVHSGLLHVIARGPTPHSATFLDVNPDAPRKINGPICVLRGTLVSNFIASCTN